MHADACISVMIAGEVTCLQTKNLDGPVPHKTSEVATCKIPHQSCKFLDGPVIHKTSEVSALKIIFLCGFSSQKCPKHLLQDTTSEL